MATIYPNWLIKDIKVYSGRCKDLIVIIIIYAFSHQNGIYYRTMLQERLDKVYKRPYSETHIISVSLLSINYGQE